MITDLEGLSLALTVLRRGGVSTSVCLCVFVFVPGLSDCLPSATGEGPQVPASLMRCGEVSVPPAARNEWNNLYSALLAVI